MAASYLGLRGVFGSPRNRASPSEKPWGVAPKEMVVWAGVVEESVRLSLSIKIGVVGGVAGILMACNASKAALTGVVSASRLKP